MQFTSHYKSPLGDITLASDESALIGLWFDGQKYFGAHLESAIQQETPAIQQAKAWLDIYFKKEIPNFTPALNPRGTEFQQGVWKILLKIPYGKTVTYKSIAEEIAKENGIAHMSAQAIGGAVGHNPISIIIPCHRVLGTSGNLTGYAGGLERKHALLQLESVLLDI